MKPEKEIKWLAILYSSKHCKYFMKNFNIYCPGSIKDFEVLLSCGENNSKFRAWFKKMLELDVFVYHSKIRSGHRNNSVSKGYVINGKELIKYSKSNSLNTIFRKFYGLETM